MRNFTARVIRQQQTAIEAKLNSERGKPAAQAQGVNEKYYKSEEIFSGKQAWRDWAFLLKSATKTANEAAYHFIETTEKEIDDALSLARRRGSWVPRSSTSLRSWSRANPSRC